MHINANFSSETELKALQDFLYSKSKEKRSFTGLLEAVINEITIITAIHNIKSNKGGKTTGVDKIKMDKYLQMPKNDVVRLIQKSFVKYQPKPAKRIYIDKDNGKKRPLGIPTILDRIMQECVRIVIEPICEAKFYPHSYGFRPYRAQKHAIADIVHTINLPAKPENKPVYALEGDIRGCFDNINHRILLQKLWKIGIHDKRIIKIIKQMLKSGYVDYDIYCSSELGTQQGGIISPLLSNVYLNDFDWYVGRQYCEPQGVCKNPKDERKRLKKNGITPKYNVRYADDWIILTPIKHEAERLKRHLKKYFKYRMKLELSEEKTKITDLRSNGAEFLGFVIKAEQARQTPSKRSTALVGKVFPNMKRLAVKITKLCDNIHALKTMPADNLRIAQIHNINSTIVGIAEYIKIGICSHAFNAIDYRVNESCYFTWKRMYPKDYMNHKIRLKHINNLPHRHENYDTKTFAIQFQNMWFGITKAGITHSKYEKFPMNQKITPYTEEGRRLYSARRKADKPLPLDRPSVNTPFDLKMAIYNVQPYNFEYYMNREYAFNRDKYKCRCCGVNLIYENKKNCHHIDNRLPLNKINKVSNLAWVCENCHYMIHGKEIPENIDLRIKKKILNFRQHLSK